MSIEICNQFIVCYYIFTRESMATLGAAADTCVACKLAVLTDWWNRRCGVSISFTFAKFHFPTHLYRKLYHDFRVNSKNESKSRNITIPCALPKRLRPLHRAPSGSGTWLAARERPGAPRQLRALMAARQLARGTHSPPRAAATHCGRAPCRPSSPTAPTAPHARLRAARPPGASLTLRQPVTMSYTVSMLGTTLIPRATRIDTNLARWRCTSSHSSAPFTVVVTSRPDCYVRCGNCCLGTNLSQHL